MKRLLSMLSLLLTVSNVTAASVGGAQINPGQIINMLTPIFNMIKTLIVTDLSRTIITFILLYIVVSKSLKAAIDKTPLKDSSSVISYALAGIAIIAIFFRARNFLDKFSWIIIAIGLAWLVFPILRKIGGKIFKGGHGYYGDYGKTKDAKNLDSKERHAEADVKTDIKKEARLELDEGEKLTKMRAYANRLNEFRNQLRSANITEEQFHQLLKEGKL